MFDEPSPAMSWLTREETRRYASTALPAQMPASVSSATSTKAAALLLRKAAVAAATVSEEASSARVGGGGHVSPSTDYLPVPFPVVFSSSSSSSTCTSGALAPNLLPAAPPQHHRPIASHLPPPLPSSFTPQPPQSLPLGRASTEAAPSPTSSASNHCLFRADYATHPIRARAASVSSPLSPPEEEETSSSRALTMLRELTQEMQHSLTESTLRRGSNPGAIYATARPYLGSDAYERHAATIQPRSREVRYSPDGREAPQSWRSSGSEERELYLSQWLPPPLPPQHRPAAKGRVPSSTASPPIRALPPSAPTPPQLGKSALTNSARKQQLRRRRQRNMTTGGLTGAFSASQTVPGRIEEPPGLRNSVSFNGINGDPRSQPQETFVDDFGVNGPLRSDSLVDVLHRRFYSHQYMERSQPLVQVASFDNANALLNSSDSPSADGLNAVDLRRINHSCGTFPKSKSMNDASCRQGISATVVEACRWLIDAGFPQYAQMLEDGAFPLDLETIREDHRFMDEDTLSALFRRINTLNECVIAQRKDHLELPGAEESLINKMGRAVAFDSPDGDASEEYALSRHWQFERDTRRWSRIEPEAVAHFAEPEPEPEPEPERRSRAAKRQGSRSESPSSRSLLRSASLRLRSAVSRFRRGDLNFRSLRRSKKGNNNSSKAQAPPPPPPDTSSAGAASNHSASSSSVTTASQNTAPPSVTGPPMATPPQPPPLPAFPSSASAHRILMAPASRLGPQTSDHGGGVSNLDRRHSAVGTTSGPNGNAAGPAMQILVNDTIDTGSGDKINIRTGSFMGKAGHRHEAYLRRRLDNVANNNNNNNNNNNIHEAPTPKVLTEDSAVTPTDDVGEEFRPAEELDRILQALYTDIDMLDEMMDAAGKSPKMTASSAPTSPRLLGVPPSGESGPSSPSDVAAQRSEIEGYDLDSQIVELKRLERMRRTGDHRRPSLERGSSLGQSSEQENSFDSASSAYRSTTSTLRRNAPSRWSSVERNYRQSVYQQDQSMGGMSVKQLILLRKIALLKLTTIMEKYCPPHKSLFSWAIPKLLRRGRSHSETDTQNKVFNVPLATIFQRTGRLLPPAVLNALDYLQAEGTSALGIFRRAGGKARTLALREQIEKDENWDDFSCWQAYDVADVVKLYFRELPECLLTNKLSSTLINIFIYLPLELRLEALQWAILRLPDENRMVLQSLLHFLRHMADHSEVTQMNASNLAVCLAPSLFNFPHALPSGLSPKRLRRVTGSPDPKDLADQKAAHECLTVMIQFSSQLFLISENILNQCQFDADELGEAPTLNSLAPPRADSLGRDWQTLAGERLAALLRDCRDRGKGWVHSSGHSCPVEIHYKKINDGHPLKMWRCAVDVEAPPEVLLHRLWSERPKWDPSVISQEVLEHLAEDADVVHLTFAPLSPPHPARECVILRMRQRGLEGGACALLTSSTTHESTPSAAQAACHPVFVMQEDILVDPCGSGKCRVHWLSRVDLRGFTAEWYGSSWSHCVARVLQLLQKSFAKSIDSRETRL